MALYTGPSYWQDDVSIGPPAVGPLRAGAAGGFARWFLEAPERDDVCYFSIYVGRALVGQILLHDIDATTGESLVGYHVFEPRQRGRGTGTKALTLLERFAAERTRLRRLVIITSRDNLASQAAREEVRLRAHWNAEGRPGERVGVRVDDTKSAHE